LQPETHAAMSAYSAGTLWSHLGFGVSNDAVLDLQFFGKF